MTYRTDSQSDAATMPGRGDAGCTRTRSWLSWPFAFQVSAMPRTFPTVGSVGRNGQQRIRGSCGLTVGRIKPGLSVVLPFSGQPTRESCRFWRHARRIVLRSSVIAAALFAALGAASLSTSASAAPMGPSTAVAAPAELVTNIRMERRMMRRPMMHRRMMHRPMMRHGMNRRGMMRHGM